MHGFALPFSFLLPIINQPTNPSAMVGVKRKVVNIIADPSHPSSANSLHSNSIDRRTKAVRSCSNWNSALLHGRRTRVTTHLSR
jgi:hypothetical protein